MENTKETVRAEMTAIEWVLARVHEDEHRSIDELGHMCRAYLENCEFWLKSRGFGRMDEPEPRLVGVPAKERDDRPQADLLG